MSSATSQRPHVLILGAGLGGLTLAQGLRKQGVSFEIFERDRNLHSRFQGWAIVLHRILSDLLVSVPDDLPPIDVTNHLLPLTLPAQFCFYKNGNRTITQSDEKTRIIRANRSRLREWLATNIDVQWNKRMTHIEEEQSSVRVFFSDGTFATGDVVVGADGVHSHVRAHLLGTKELLNTIPVGLVLGQTILDKEQFKRQLEIAHSAYVVMAENSRLFVGLDSVAEDGLTAKYYWIIDWRDPKAKHEPYWTAAASKQELHAKALELSELFEPKFVEVIRLTKMNEIVTPPIVLRDMILEHLPKGRITLLGDAAHPMTPYRGEGGNHAMQDALNLARALGKSDRTNPEPLLKEYQDEMLTRGAEAVRNSRAATTDSGKSTTEGWARWRGQ